MNSFTERKKILTAKYVYTYIALVLENLESPFYLNSSHARVRVIYTIFLQFFQNIIF